MVLVIASLPTLGFWPTLHSHLFRDDWFENKNLSAKLFLLTMQSGYSALPDSPQQSRPCRVTMQRFGQRSSGISAATQCLPYNNNPNVSSRIFWLLQDKLCSFLPASGSFPFVSCPFLFCFFFSTEAVSVQGYRSQPIQCSTPPSRLSGSSLYSTRIYCRYIQRSQIGFRKEQCKTLTRARVSPVRFSYPRWVSHPCLKKGTSCQ